MVDFDLAQLLEKRPSFSQALVESLEDALRRLRESPYYSRYQGIPLRNFLPGGTGGLEILARQSLSELCSQGAITLCSHSSVEVGNIRALVMLLNHLAELDPDSLDSTEKQADNSLQTASPPQDTSHQERVTTSEKAEQTPSSLAKTDLREEDDETFSGPLAKEGDSPTFSLSLLENIENVPEEQGSSMPNDGTLSTTAHTPPIKESTLNHSAIFSENARSFYEQPLSIVSLDQAPLPSYATVLMKYLREERTGGGKQGSGAAHEPFETLIHEITESLSDKEMMVTWLTAEHSPPLVATLLRTSPEAIGICRDDTLRVIAGIIAKGNQQIQKALTSALYAPALSFDTALEALSMEQRDPLRLTIARMILYSLGAREGIFPDDPVQGVWSQQERVVQILLQAIVTTLPRSLEDVEEELRSLFPLLPLSLSTALLGRFAECDAAAGTWQAR
jgi:hypothetical protein